MQSSTHTHTPAHQAFSLFTELGESYKRVIKSALRKVHMISEERLLCMYASIRQLMFCVQEYSVLFSHASVAPGLVFNL